MWIDVLIAVAIGIAGETSAYIQRLWVYRRPLYPIVNVLVVFGLVMGSIASLAGHFGLAVVFGLGFGVGLVYELLNFAVLDWWYFPGDRLYALRGKMACAVGVSVGWGLVPAAVVVLRGR
jgi:hypothetical protein